MALEPRILWPVTTFVADHLAIEGVRNAGRRRPVIDVVVAVVMDVAGTVVMIGCWILVPLMFM
jgi:hypothetical protein